MQLDHVNKGLYEKVYEGKNCSRIVNEIKRDSTSYNIYCVQCQKESVFMAELQNILRPTGSLTGPHTPPPPNYELNGDFHFGKKLFCAKCKSILVNYFEIVDDKILKVGTFPSIADLDTGRMLNDCNISKSKFPKGLCAAIGLKAQGVYVGAYAYLRRVYEKLIIEAAAKAKEDGFLDENFNDMRAQEKIAALKDFLPTMMVENRMAYGILSKGIHELSEEECQKGYDVLFSLIVMILEENEERRKKELRKKELSKAINELNGRLIKG